ncbi:MAG: hypothetical protein R3B09_28625 [Nannocystaceae bacterium]
MTPAPRSHGSSLAALLLLPLVLWLGAREAAPEVGRVVHVDARDLDLDGEHAPISAARDQVADEVAADPLVGVWHRFPAHSEGDLIRFYYFHGDGHGLYRYGKVGLTNTHAFDYQVVGGRVELRFRKTGERREVDFAIEEDDARPGRTWLVLADDPREQGEVRYFRDAAPAELGACEGGEAAGEAIDNRLWIDQRSHAAGGLGFTMYQLQRQTIDGRGVGWFHRGDYDEWTTEALTFRRQGDVLTLHFMLSGESTSARIQVERDDRGRTLEIAGDPRDYWHDHRYLDGGPSFAGAAADEAIPWRCLPQ